MYYFCQSLFFHSFYNECADHELCFVYAGKLVKQLSMTPEAILDTHPPACGCFHKVNQIISKNVDFGLIFSLTKIYFFLFKTKKMLSVLHHKLQFPFFRQLSQRLHPLFCFHFLVLSKKTKYIIIAKWIGCYIIKSCQSFSPEPIFSLVNIHLKEEKTSLFQKLFKSINHMWCSVRCHVVFEKILLPR